MNNVQHVVLLFFFNEPDTTEIYTLSLHDALPISYATHQEEIDSLIRNLNENVPELMSKVTTIMSNADLIFGRLEEAGYITGRQKETLIKIGRASCRERV